MTEREFEFVQTEMRALAKAVRLEVAEEIAQAIQAHFTAWHPVIDVCADVAREIGSREAK